MKNIYLFKNDEINGSDEKETLEGGGGNDTIDGGLGDDVIIGSKGDDNINGGWIGSGDIGKIQRLCYHCR
ncbi:hypothetical protein [Okeania sp. SIO1F9]|uniref:hypothetical protein n=1 Tax=Okeania sp. SIO1F9 TaxID=2607813 RepID=UPI00144FF774|nr:hypothetical protein [Okeania sp. SIO1F9]